jgi:putative endonuclease
MHYVYLLRSESHPEETYIGLASDLKSRLQKHNDGGSAHTVKFRPWKLVTYLAFSSRQQASEFESYMKTGSGRAFAKKQEICGTESWSGSHSGGSSNNQPTLQRGTSCLMPSQTDCKLFAPIS